LLAAKTNNEQLATNNYSHDRQTPESTLRLGLPSGSLQNATVDLFGKAGYRVSIADRSVFPRVDDDKISAVLFRAQEISRYVTDGIIDCGLTGHDWIVENGNEKDVVEICELEYSRASRNPARWVLAVPEESDIRKPEDLNGKIIATELVNTTRRYFEQRGSRSPSNSPGAPPRSRPVCWTASSILPRRVRPSVPTICGLLIRS